MMRNILVLAFNDLAIALKNKTFFLVLFIPLFVFVSLNLVDSADSDSSKVKIGLIQHDAYAPEIIRSVNAAEKLVAVTWVQDEKESVRLLKEHKLDGVLTGNEKAPGSLALLVLKKILSIPSRSCRISLRCRRRRKEAARTGSPTSNHCTRAAFKERLCLPGY